jgi:hypothetical protein
MRERGEKTETKRRKGLKVKEVSYRVGECELV